MSNHLTHTPKTVTTTYYKKSYARLVEAIEYVNFKNRLTKSDSHYTPSLEEYLFLIAVLLKAFDKIDIGWIPIILFYLAYWKLAPCVSWIKAVAKRYSAMSVDYIAMEAILPPKPAEVKKDEPEEPMNGGSFIPAPLDPADPVIPNVQREPIPDEALVLRS